MDMSVENEDQTENEEVNVTTTTDTGDDEGMEGENANVAVGSYENANVTKTPVVASISNESPSTPAAVKDGVADQAKTEDDTVGKGATEGESKEIEDKKADEPAPEDGPKVEEAPNKPQDDKDNGEEDDSNAHCCVCQSGEATEDNDVILCDGPGCNRAYHQLCHFLPVFVIPRGNWYCLICEHKLGPTSTQKKKRGRPAKNPPIKPAICTVAAPATSIVSTEEFSNIYPPFDVKLASQKSPPCTTEDELRLERILSPPKPALLKRNLQSIWNAAKSSLLAIRTHQNTIRTYTSNSRTQSALSSHELTQANAKLAKHKHRIRTSLLGLKKFISATRKHEPKFDDEVNDDPSIPASRITCCVCFSSDSTDENDILLCDGRHCFRAFHMRCLDPALSQEDLSSEAWFCPYCTSYATLLHYVQDMYMGDESVEKEWEDADEVFEGETDFDGQDGGESSDDEDFDPEKGEEEDKGEGNENDDGDEDDDDDDGTSVSTLAGMSDVEATIDKSELDALSEDEVGVVGENGKRARRNLGAVQDSKGNDDIGKLDAANILKSKRNRNKVDYRQLNDAMFGQVSAKAIPLLDDEDDFQNNDEASSNSDSASESETSEDLKDIKNSNGGNTAHRKRGRPRKHPIPNPNSSPDGTPKKRGRPRKTPPPDSANSTPTPVKKKRGRPRKSPLPESATSLIPGMPSSASPKKRGRPRKNPLPGESAKDLSAPGNDGTTVQEVPMFSAILQGDANNTVNDGKPPSASQGDANNTVNDVKPPSASDTPKKKRGRPRKDSLPVTPNNTTPISDTPKKKRGRPRKNPPDHTAVSPVVPPVLKNEDEMPTLVPLTTDKQDTSPVTAITTPSTIKKKRGRPRKTPEATAPNAVATPTPSSNSVASPLNTATPGSTPPTKKKRGRPRKNPLPQAAPQTSPNTVASPSTGTPPAKKKRGRPRKNSLPNGTGPNGSIVTQGAGAAAAADADAGRKLDQEISAVEQSLNVTNVEWSEEGKVAISSGV
mmetsp:Transcript_38296/g.46760  ORF Transcript_38296/g.46760 Transcript_38296/m.46760 type:complete len:1003 (+) Transcript_38296:18-3026(+)|eukprot:CAMPEP_0172517854 /NCGR_PEP_ID=MMETSP1066-20121228/288423_1 /TAXON_ID=671091 /ORGANISM="Coscinodiscus wailesii, Strain CCMP2513" /LENGTH=1002 /DNA_ID=CAMNT_0013300045 /DNA_START=9 /DNA_END=3017 /DNA_ORIENTATION=+